MHADEVATDAVLVRRLLAAQFPDWADLPIERAVSDGTDNAIYRLGDELAVRLPRIHWAAEQPEKEHRWLPRLAPLFPLPVPVPVAIGEPAEGYPWSWTVVPWLRGENATPERLDDPRLAAATLGEFVAALQRIDIAGGPTPPGRTTPPGASRWRIETPPFAPRSRSWATRSMPAPSRRPGKQPSRRLCGAARRSGCTETSSPGTCLRGKVGWPP